MKLIYMGTPQFAVPPLQALRDAGHTVLAVVTRADKPAGRGRALTPPPVKVAALAMGIPVHQPHRVREPAFVDTLRSLAPDVIVVAAYGQILPAEVLRLPRFGCLNIHASLLPKYRGAAPVNWAIIGEERETGITIMQMDEGMDTGAILLQERVPIGPDDTAGTLLTRLADLGSRMIVTALALADQGGLAPVPQDSSLATLAPLLTKEDGRIDWRLPAEAIDARVRGLSPWPGAFTTLDGITVKVLTGGALPGTAGPGVISTPEPGVLVVGTGKGLFRVDSLQPAGKRPMSAAEFLRGHRNVQEKKFTDR